MPFTAQYTSTTASILDFFTLTQNLCFCCIYEFKEIHLDQFPLVFLFLGNLERLEIASTTSSMTILLSSELKLAENIEPAKLIKS